MLNAGRIDSSTFLTVIAAGAADAVAGQVPLMFDGIVTSPPLSARASFKGSESRAHGA